MLSVRSWSLVSALVALAIAEYSHSVGSGHLNVSTYTIECDSNLDSNCESLSLNEVAATIKMNSVVNYIIEIIATHLEVGEGVVFSQLDSLTINGNPNVSTTIDCRDKHIAFIFDSLADLTLTELTITNCGAIHNGTVDLSVAVKVFQCRDVTIDNITIEKSVGVGLAITDHQGGSVQIERSNFSENKIPKHDYINTSGGGGVFVGNFTHDPFDSVSMNFNNCTFRDNVAHTTFYDYLYTDDLGNPVTGYGFGGGAAILLEGNLTDVHIAFSNCTFERNEAFKGAGLAVSIEGMQYSKTRNVTVSLESCSFRENGNSDSKLTVSGGGMHVNFASESQDTSSFESNHISMYGVHFSQNHAHFGGGLYFYSDLDRNQSNTIHIEKCMFKENMAHTGSAVDITPNVFQRSIRGYKTTPLFRDCEFFYNKVSNNNNFQLDRSQTTYGIGTVYVSLYDIRFEGCNGFENNEGTAIHIVDGAIDMSKGSAHFHNNSGIMGGGIALIGESSLIVGPNRNYAFINNTALGKGGGLFSKVIDNHGITASKTCFIQYQSLYTHAQDWSASIYFRGNRAQTGNGHTIFATALHSCRTINVGTIEKLNLTSVNAPQVFQVRNIEIEDQVGVDGYQIATEGAILNSSNSTPLKVIPGERFKHGVVIKDDLQQETKVVLTVSVVNNTNVQLGAGYSSCIGEHLMLTGRPGEFAGIHLQTTTSRSSYLKLTIELVQCPPGFWFDTRNDCCTCNAREYTGFVKCGTDIFESYIAPGFWAGEVSDAQNASKKELVTSYCTFKFCDYNGTNLSTGSKIRLPQTSEKLNEAICGTSRMGISCGSCAPNYTTHFHSPMFTCMLVNLDLCNVGWLFYILSELVPVTLMFIIVIVFNISFTTGAVNGFILFSQLISSLNTDANGFINFPRAVDALTRVYQIIYGVFNFDMFHIEELSFCLWPNASALDMLAIKYVTILYALFLIVLVIVAMNRCHRMARCFGKCCRYTTVKASVVHGLSTFLILCYSQCLRVSLNLLTGYNLLVRKNSDLNVLKRVWLNGNIIYFSRQHLLYALPALFCLLTIGLFPLLVLLVLPLMNKMIAFVGLDGSKFVRYVTQKVSISSLKPLIDSFQGCFKDDLRYFAGLYFLYRGIPLVLSISSSNFSILYAFLEAFFIVLLLLHTLFQPYAQNKHNIIDALLFADLALIQAITFVHYYSFRINDRRADVKMSIIPTAVLQLILIYVPLVVALLYMLRLLCGLRYGQGWKRAPVKSTSKPMYKLREFVSSFSHKDDVDDDFEELPHRLTAPNIDYECFDDTDHTMHLAEETDVIRDTY